MIKHWMNDHSELKERPFFKFSILGRYKDCLSRQVAEAIRILNTKDEILNSRNEYLENCIPRIVVDSSRLERMKRERSEEQTEKDELRRLELFRLEKQSKKRSSGPDDTKRSTIARGLDTSEPKMKKMRRNHSLDDGFLAGVDLGAWFEEVENRFLRVGALRERMRLESLEVIRRMDQWRLDNILMDIGSWWNMIEEEYNFEMIKNGMDSNPREEDFLPAFIPQEEWPNWCEGDSMQTEEKYEDASSLREGIRTDVSKMSEIGIGILTDGRVLMGLNRKKCKDEAAGNAYTSPGQAAIRGSLDIIGGKLTTIAKNQLSKRTKEKVTLGD